MNIQGLLDKYKGMEGERFFSEVFNDKEYSQTLDVKADVVVDIGACAGEFSAYIHDHAVTIYALEPYSKHFKELEDNVKEFGLTNVKPLKLGISGQNGQRQLLIQNRGGHTISGVYIPNAQYEDIQTKTLATFMKDEGIDHIDVLKIDVEMAEAEIFNAPDFEEVSDKISMIIGEHLDEARQILESLGFKCKDGSGPNKIYTR
jgi:FkbM family methyltransferase